jgi:hypothetical protein
MEMLIFLNFLLVAFTIILFLILQDVIQERDSLYLDNLRKDSRIEYLTAAKKQ